MTSNKKFYQIKNAIQNYLSEYLENLLLLIFGFGLGVKVIVVNHQVDPRSINLELMAADYILIMAAPLITTALGMMINKWMPEDQD